MPARRDPAVAPSQLLIPGISLDMQIRPVGLNDSGQMDLPDRPEILGWYRFGPAPGTARGSAVLAGHIDSRQYGIGPLVAVNELKRDEDICITSGQNTLHFEVTDVPRISKRRLDLTRLFARDGEPQLRIVTCGGDLDAARGGYQDNVIVTASLRTEDGSQSNAKSYWLQFRLCCLNLPSRRRSGPMRGWQLASRRQRGVSGRELQDKLQRLAVA